MNPELEKNLHTRVAMISQQIELKGVHDFTNGAFRRAHEGIEGGIIMDVARSVGNTKHDPEVRQAVYGFGFAIGLELFAHGISQQHYRSFIAELQDIKDKFDQAQKPHSSNDDINVAVSLSEQAYETYQEKTAIHSVVVPIWHYLERGGGNEADFETAVGIISLAIEKSRLMSESESEPLIGEPYDLEQARETILRTFEGSPKLQKLRDDPTATRPALLEALGQAIIAMNSDLQNLPFLQSGTSACIRGGAFYMIFDKKSHTKTYHSLPADWRLSGTFDRLAVDEIPSLEELRIMEGKKQLSQFSKTFPSGVFMLLNNVALEYDESSHIELSRAHEIYVPMNYPIAGTLLPPPTP